MNIFIVTALPFRKKGNQSLLRFIDGLIKRGHRVSLFSSGSDKNGEKFYKHENYESYENIFSNFIVLRNGKNILKIDEDIRDNLFLSTKSEDVIPPYGEHNFKVFLKKWFKFLGNVIANLIFTLYLIVNFHSKIKKNDVIISYEMGNALCGKILSIIYRKKYINKYQGTILKAVNGNLYDAIKYYPIEFFGINKSDLCIMVNDGTNGDYWARIRGCRNVYFQPHGVAIEDYSENVTYENRILNDNNDEKLILFNNASNSNWKRVDRVINILNEIRPEYQNKVHIYSTFFGSHLEMLKQKILCFGLKNHITFLNNFDHVDSNNFMRASDILIMTNDFSNLGNPILEAAYYNVPIITIDDKSLDGVINENKFVSFKLDDNFNKSVAKYIQNICDDITILDKMRNCKEAPLTIDEQQNKEFFEIETVIKKI